VSIESKRKLPDRRQHALRNLTDAERTGEHGPKGAYPAKYECTACGDRYAVRSSAPSCRVATYQLIADLLEQHAPPTLALQHVSLDPFEKAPPPKETRQFVDHILLKQYRVMGGEREWMWQQYDKWVAWKTGTPKSVAA
jgi:hypothetical protein